MDEEEGHLPIGTAVWFPSQWECGTIDSVLTGAHNEVLAYIVMKADGTKVAVDMQVADRAGAMQ